MVEWVWGYEGRRGVKVAAETPGGAVCSDSWVWRGVRVGVRGARARAGNKGFARRPPEILAWEVGGRM